MHHITMISFKAGFPKVGQSAALGAMTDTQAATSTKGVRWGAMRS